MVNGNAEWYHNMMSFKPELIKPQEANSRSYEGCPYDCGYCSNHQQKVFLPVVPVTSACNLNCPVCYTINKNRNPYFMTRDEFAQILKQIRAMDPDMQIINFTGGEPLTHPDFCGLVEMCKDAGIHRITISTNGLKFLEDKELLPRLTELQSRIVLSFNSFRPEPYIKTAGTDLLNKKLAILDLLKKYKPATTLLSVVGQDVNEREIGDRVKYVMDNDFVVSSEIHTVTYTGQSVTGFAHAARLNVWDVVSDISDKNTYITPDDFLPSPCAHPMCYTTCYLLKLESGKAVPFSNFIQKKEAYELLKGNLYIEPNINTEEIFTDALNDLWSNDQLGALQEEVFQTMNNLIRSMYPVGGLDYFERQKLAEKSTKAIYIHSHMDEDTFDTNRIAQCCVVVPDGENGYIPTCTYNNIYRARDSRFSESSKQI